MKRRHFPLILLVVLVLMLGTGRTVVAKGIFGGSDFINSPTNRVIPSGGYTLGAHIAEDRRGRIQLDYGLVTDFELGAAIDLSRKDHEFSVRFKYQFIPETQKNFGLALGIQDIGKDRFSPYVVFGHVLAPHHLRWNFGLGGGELGGLFFGISKVFNPDEFPQVTLVGEYDAYSLNLGAKILLKKGILLNVAVIDMQDFLVGLTISN
jgi:hypothetical protein